MNGVERRRCWRESRSDTALARGRGRGGRRGVHRGRADNADDDVGPAAITDVAAQVRQRSNNLRRLRDQALKAFMRILEN